MEPYLARFEQDRRAGGYVVTFPDFAYGVTQGETDIELWRWRRSSHADHRRLYSRDEAITGAKALRRCEISTCAIIALQAVKVDLYNEFLKSGLKRAEFARRIGIPRTHIERLFSLRHHSRLEQIEAAFAALGKRLHVEARNAA